MFSQIFAITGLNLKSIPQRWAASLVIVVGLAGVVAVFTALLAMATGFESTLQANGRTDAAIILRGGSDSELNSGLGRDNTILIKQAPGIRKGADGLPLASAEVMVIAELIRKSGRQYFLAVNKAEGMIRERVAADFFELGLGEPLPSVLPGRRDRTVTPRHQAGHGTTPIPWPTA